MKNKELKNAREFTLLLISVADADKYVWRWLACKISFKNYK